jgi:GT2 family glycosyltransferase
MIRPGPIATVVIVNYNGAHLLPDCLDALDAQRTGAPEFETVVVDNASVDDSVELLEAKYPWVRIVVSATNLGFAGGNNLALRQVTTPFAVLLNNDATPEPGWLANLLAPFAADDAEHLGMVTGKIVFRPRFVRVAFGTSGFRPGVHDARELGVRVYAVIVRSTEMSADVTAKVLWESAAYGLERIGDLTYRWTRPTGEVLVPMPLELTASGQLREPVAVTLRVAAERTKELSIGSDRFDVGTQPSEVELRLPTGTPTSDVINNVGGVVLRDGYGADRGFQQLDHGQFDQPEEVFTACGNGLAIRSEIGAHVGWFDDDFFMYYEDVDLSWRVRALGWSIRYQPDAVLRHIHAASSTEWSPRWVFHVDRNRLLTLTKNASVRLAASAVLRYPLTTASMALRAGIEGMRVRRRPALRPYLLRAAVFASYLRLLPRMLRRRRAIARSASVGRPELESWLVTRS